MSAPRGLLGDAIAGLLRDPDPLVRLGGVAMVRWFDPASVPLLRQLQTTETDLWVRFRLRECLDERSTAAAWDDAAEPA